MPISNKDELNILYVSQYDISPAEKVKAVRLIGEVEKAIAPIFAKQKNISEKSNSKEKILLLAAVYILLKREFNSLSERTFKEFLNMLCPLHGKISEYSIDWLKAHSERVAKYIARASMKCFIIGKPEKAASDERILNIVRNEIMTTYNLAEIESLLQQGYKKKKWVCTIDGRERKTHHEANGQEKPILEPFEVGGELMMFPKDDSYGASAAETVNCRCSIRPVK